ncbi:Ni/Fe-hydrogenase, b-type cytochrome subunit [Rhodoblastus sp.]|uniref:Ni/Fe-hydrogenase, b-type cytochrome subunit n=1 Tax=Rhodoblastus sp. TaxID=1962975 RepID=UPI003F9E41E7
MTELTQTAGIPDTLVDTTVARRTGAVLGDLSDARGEKEISRRTVYVYQAPVRLWHWVNALAMVSLFVTGYLIASPPASLSGEASAHFQMGYIRFVHFAAGQIMAVGFLLRIYWAFVGNAHAKQIFYIPFWRSEFWLGVLHEIRWYAFLEKYPKQYVGHNPLAQSMMFLMFTLGTLFMICTGFALYSQGEGSGSLLAKAFGWVFVLFPNSQEVHTLHHLGMWVLVIFTIVHIYAAVREDIMSRQSMISSMISGERQFRDEV